MTTKAFLHGDVIEGSWSVRLGARDGAWFSHPDYAHRTLLWRTFEGEVSREAPLVFCMLNPSTANHTFSDPTILRCLGFALREGAGGILVVNLATYRTPDPKRLRNAHKAGLDVFFREHNEHAWKVAQSYGAKMIAAWGAGADPYLDRSQINAIDWYCFGTTKQGHPRHPLYLRNDAPLTQFLGYLDPVKQTALPDRCGESYCLCSGGKHVACKAGREKDQAARQILETLRSR